MLKTRVLTALIGIPLFLVLLALPGGHAFCAAVCVIACLGLWEFGRAFRATAHRPSAIFLFAGAMLPLWVWFFTVQPEEARTRWVAIVLPVVLTIALLAVFWEFHLGRAKETHPIAHNLGLGLLGAGYVGGLISFLILLRLAPSTHPLPGGLDGGIGWVMLTMAPLWAGDSAAYFVGRAFGKRKLAPQLSPNKTWEGAWANFGACGVVGTLLAMSLGVSVGTGLLLGAGIGILGQVGDLFESAMKRSLGIKDFGALLPGHGGALDRFDSALFCAPYVWCLLNGTAVW